MARVFYGDQNDPTGYIQFDLVKTNSISQEMVMSDDGIDYLYTRFVFNLSCVANLNTFTQAQEFNVSNLADVLNAIRAQIEQPRQKLVIELEERQLDINGNSFETGIPYLEFEVPDVAAGPKVRVMNITRVIRANLVYFNVQIEAAQPACKEDDSSEQLIRSKVLSNRWSSQMSYDTNTYCTRVTTGVLTLDGRQLVLDASGNITPDIKQLRYWVRPALPVGWVREGWQFAVAPDGLKIAYSFTDREVKVVPPRGCTKLEGVYTESVENGTIGYADFTVTVEAPKTTSLALVIQRAAAIIHSRFEFTNTGQQNIKDTLVASHIREDITKNAITIYVRVKRAALVIASAFGLYKYTKFGKYIPNSTDGAGYISDPFGTALISNMVAAWKGPCDTPQTHITEGVTSGTTFPSGSIRNDPEVGVLDLGNITTSELQLLEENIKYSFTKIIDPVTSTLVEDTSGEAPWTSSHKEHPYDDAQMDVAYETDQHTIQVPIAGSSVDLVGGSSQQTSSSVAIQLARPTTKKTITSRAQRSGNHPLMPSPNATILGQTLLAKTIIAETPQVMPDGTNYKKAIRAKIELAMTDVVDEKTTALDAGSLPYDSSDVASNLIPTDVWVDDLFEQPVAPAV